MEIFDNYLKYRKHKPEYKPWKGSQNDIEAKRLAYIEKNGITEGQKQIDIKRAQAVLNSVDIMDEYSQTRAEDMELTAQGVQHSLIIAATYLGAGVGLFAIFKTKFGRHIMENLSSSGKFSAAPIMILPTIISVIAAMLPTPFLTAWATKKEIEASRIGRHESMNKELSSEKQFAILTDEQERQRDEIAKGIKVDKKESKKSVDAAKGSFGIIKSFKLIFSKNEDYKKSKAEFDKKWSEDRSKFDKVKLSDKDIEEAKKDQQLISNVVEKIDIASQDYAENLELATTAFQTAALGSGGLLGFLTSKILRNVKFKGAFTSKIIAGGVGGVAFLTIALASAKIQKQGSRVARFKVKQDFMNNPEKLMYVDDKKAENIDGTKFNKQEEKPGFFKFLIKVVKDNNEYNKYLKKENIVLQQKRRAQEQIELTPEQQKRAQQLQKNVFKMFNKVDENSQKYSESVECLGETVQSISSFLLSIPLLLGMNKVVDDVVDSACSGSFFKIMKPIVKPMLFMFAPVMIMSAYVTKQQKNASRVADMLAIKEMQDPKEFVDYNNLSPVEFNGEQENKKEASAPVKSKYLIG